MLVKEEKRDEEENRECRREKL
uniref:Uncharacterized protein n=1 Tax=Arundo donax TaxID=35708 RepID=A0A0A8XZQ1_ARUDO